VVVISPATLDGRLYVLVSSTAFLNSAQGLLYYFPLKMNSELYFLKQADRSKVRLHHLLSPWRSEPTHRNGKCQCQVRRRVTRHV